jgi:ABC-type antimicrobial peptide transport system permease subunit
MSLHERLAERGYDSDDDEILRVPAVDDVGKDAIRARPSKLPTALVWLTACLLQVGVYFKLNGKDIRARKGTYCLGVSSCLVVVLITALMLTVLNRLPIVFLRLAEIERGENDLVLTAGGEASRAQSLNYSRVLAQPRFGDRQPASFHTARIRFDPDLSQVTVRNLRACRTASGGSFSGTRSSLGEMWTANPNATVTAAPSGADEFTNTTCSPTQGCPEQYCDGRAVLPGTVYLIDFDREQRMGLGRAWSLLSPGRGHCIIHEDLARLLHINAGDTLLVQLDVSPRILQAFIEAELDDWLEPPYTTWGTVIMPLTVGAITSSNGGKFPQDASDYVLIDYDSALLYMSAYLSPWLGARKRALFATADVWSMATEIVFNMPPWSRTEDYSQSDAANVLAAGTAFATPIIATLGFNQLSVEMPIVSYIQDNRFFALFLGLILSLLILGLGFLCIVLIHSLLTVGVETRTFELGIMRMVGMTRPMLTGYVVTGALLFAIPAWLVGLLFAQVIFFLMVSFLESNLGVTLSPFITPEAAGYATLVGIAMPLLSSIAPILSVLALDLPKALDVHRSRTSVITYDIQRGGAYHINWTAAGIGLAMAVAGFLVYYMFPLALLTFNITLLFYIFFGILLGMLFGLVLLTNALEGVVELGIMYAFLWWESEAVFTLIRKNLIAHRPRNRKTTLMFAMSIGFLIFLSVTASIQIESVVYESERTIGGDLNVLARRRGNSTVPFSVLEACAAKLEAVNIPGLRWTWVSSNMNDQTDLANATFSTIGRYMSIRPFLAAAPPGFYEVTNNKYLITKEVRDSSWPLAESLYSYDGSSRLILSSVFKRDFAFESLDDAFMLEAERVVGNDTVTIRSLAQSEAWLDSSPVVQFSEYTAAGSGVLLSYPSMLQRSQGAIRSVESLFIRKMVITVPGGEAAAKRVRTLLEGTLVEIGMAAFVQVTDIYSARSSLAIATTVINLFFTFAQVMATFICYFALSSSMSTNIHEQAKEIGILRCVGFRTWPLTRTYVWEAFVLVFASSLLGIVVGVVMGYTIVLQRALFTQLPLPFVFPWMQLLVVLGLSFALGFFSSFGPVRALLRNKSVTTILRQAL